MSPDRFHAITDRYAKLRVGVIGDFCLDRYLEIDPTRSEISIETGLPVHNVVKVRSQPGGAGTILNNLVALGVGDLTPVGFCGNDGEGFELLRALHAMRNVRMTMFLHTPLRNTFTYTKPLIVKPGEAPMELSRLDMKNWTETPESLQSAAVTAFNYFADHADAVILLDQVDMPGTGVISRRLLESVRAVSKQKPGFPILADSRRGLGNFPPVVFKMNATELRALTGAKSTPSIADTTHLAAELARQNQRCVFVTMAEQGIVGAAPDGQTEHVPALPVRGEIDIVGAGDSVTANLTAALAAGASLREAIELANAAASIVIHQLGTTGTASVAQLRTNLCGV